LSGAIPKGEGHYALLKQQQQWVVVVDVESVALTKMVVSEMELVGLVVNRNRRRVE
jgi:hypothetical protein